MVIHDTECPYWDQVSLNNPNPNQDLFYLFCSPIDILFIPMLYLQITNYLTLNAVNTISFCTAFLFFVFKQHFWWKKSYSDMAYTEDFMIKFKSVDIAILFLSCSSFACVSFNIFISAPNTKLNCYILKEMAGQHRLFVLRFYELTWCCLVPFSCISLTCCMFKACGRIV